MNVLIGCEYSATVRDAFIRLGHNAWSCDLLPSESFLGPHHQGDIVEALSPGGALFHIKWDLFIFHPDCTYLTCSAEWCYKDVEFQKKKLSPDKLYGAARRAARRAAREEALKFVEWGMSLPIETIVTENPVGVISTRIRPADQYIQPYDYGEDASKRTGLWLKNLPLLKPTKRFKGRIVNHKGKLVERWSNQTDSGQNRLPPSEDRWKVRSLFYRGWADAMALQWGGDIR